MSFRKILGLGPNIHERTMQHIREEMLDSHVEHPEHYIKQCEDFAELHRRVEALAGLVSQRTHMPAPVELEGEPLKRLLAPKEKLNRALVRSAGDLTYRDLYHMFEDTRHLERCKPVIDRLLYHALELTEKGDLDAARSQAMATHVDELMESRIRFAGKLPSYLEHQYAKIAGKEWEIGAGTTWMDFCKSVTEQGAKFKL